MQMNFVSLLSKVLLNISSEETSLVYNIVFTRRHLLSFFKKNEIT